MLQKKRTPRVKNKNTLDHTINKYLQSLVDSPSDSLSLESMYKLLQANQNSFCAFISVYSTYHTKKSLVIPMPPRNESGSRRQPNLPKYEKSLLSLPRCSTNRMPPEKRGCGAAGGAGCGDFFAGKSGTKLDLFPWNRRGFICATALGPQNHETLSCRPLEYGL